VVSAAALKVARRLAALAIAGLALWAPVQAGPVPAGRDRAMPRYDHIFVIVGENKGFERLMDHPELTPNLVRLAAEYGSASQFYTEVHPSEGNYVAMLGGDTFGIHDDDAFYCKPHLKDPFCEQSERPGYADHTVHAPSLTDQLAAQGLSWKGYYEDLPGAGSLVPRWPNAGYPVEGKPEQLYAAKHNGFVSFAHVQDAPYLWRARHIVNFRQLDADLASGDLPNYAHIVPNQCNEMHGLGSDDAPVVPEGCREEEDEAAVIRRGDFEFATLVDKITHSKVWRERGNVAIVITFDENDKPSRRSGRQGCCGYDPASAANFGGGRIPTIVITNHGPRGLVDPTPYNHYSLLRTTEAAFGIRHYLGHAADRDKGVVAMTPLFAVQAQR
jgi:phospholipase C